MNAGWTGDPEPFDCSQPIRIDLGRAAVIAEQLRQSGYPSCFADEVTAELAKPEPERSLIGKVAAEILRIAGSSP